MRKICRRLFYVGLLWLITLTWLSPRLEAQEPPARFDPRFGLVDSFVNIEEGNAAGAGWTRIFLRWDVVQPGGPSDWKPANVPDTFLDAEIAAGREIVAVLIGTPAWATPGGASTAVPPLEFWGDFVFKIATQYKGRIKHWVIWNQPDVSDPGSPNHTWDGSEEDYFRLLKEAYFKIKTVDPAMQVHLAGLTYTEDMNQARPQYLVRLLDLLAADPQVAEADHFFDVVSYHLYYNPRQMLDILIDLRSILDSYGLSHKPIWINETNAPPTEDFLEPLPDPTTLSITLEEQSAFLIQAFSLALAGGAERVAVNKLRNETNHPESTEPYGLLRGDNSRRPAFNAFQVVTRHFAGMAQITWQQLGELYIVTLDRNGQTTTVLWTVGRTPTLYRLNAISDQALLVDERGNELPISPTGGVYTVELPAAICSNGANCFIGGAPRLIIERGSPDQRPPLLPLLTATPPPPPPAASTPVPTDAPPPLPTLTPTPTSPLPPTPVVSGEGQNSTTDLNTAISDEGQAPPAALPDPGLDLAQSENPDSAETVASVTPVPQVSLGTVLNPRRILWLLIIGLIVFTVSYGLQVAIWYRFRR